MKPRHINVKILGWDQDLVEANLLNYIDVYNMINRYPSNIQINEYTYDIISRDFF